MAVQTIEQGSEAYPSAVRSYLDNTAPRSIACIGSLAVLGPTLTAIYCSVKCPGSLIIRMYDLAQHLRAREVTTISGFHSPIEQECLITLLRGTGKVIICPARSIEGMRIPSTYKQPLADGRLSIVSPFQQGEDRATSKMAVYRNRFVAALATEVFVAYAEPGGKTEALCREVIELGKLLYTFEHAANAALLAMGAKPYSL